MVDDIVDLRFLVLRIQRKPDGADLCTGQEGDQGFRARRRQQRHPAGDGDRELRADRDPLAVRPDGDR